MSENKQISVRLRDFGNSKFPSMAAFGRALDMRPQELYRYLNGTSKPGNILQVKLRSLGCDIEWLMTGKEAGERKIPTTSNEDLSMLRKLKSMGIDSLEKLEAFCDPDRIAKDVAMVLHDKIARYKVKGKIK